MSASTGANMYSAQNPPEKSSPHVVETDRKNRFTANRSPSSSSQDSTVENLHPSAEPFESPSAEKLPPARWHFPRLCDNSTWVPHPYRIHLFRSSQTENRSSNGTLRTHDLAYRPLTTTGITPSVDESLSVPASDAPFGASSAGGTRFLATCPETSRLPSPVAADRESLRSGGRDRQEHYQLAFLTPGIRPFDAISRNWIRLMPN